jgi:hypothetical protein
LKRALCYDQPGVSLTGIPTKVKANEIREDAGEFLYPFAVSAVRQLFGGSLLLAVQGGELDSFWVSLHAG